MRYGFVAALLSFLAAFAVAQTPIARADDAPKDVKGLFLMSDYPAVTVRPGETSTVNLRIQNYDLAPERLALSVTGVPAGWTATLLGGGQPIAAAMPASNSSVALSLRLDVPKDAATGTQTLTVAAQGTTSNLQLPIAVTLAKDLPAKLTLTPQLPQLRGTSKSSFEYQLGIKNDSGKKLTVSLSAQAPANFDTTFTEQYGSQELNAVPVDAGQTKDVKLKITPPNTAAAGDYKITARIGAEDASATSDLEMTITGQPRTRYQRPRRPCLDARIGRQGDIGTGRYHQYRHGARRRYPVEWLGAKRLEDHLRSKIRRSHRAERQQGGAGPDHADRQGDRRRLRDHGPRRRAR